METLFINAFISYEVCRDLAHPVLTWRYQETLKKLVSGVIIEWGIYAATSTCRLAMPSQVARVALKMAALATVFFRSSSISWRVFASLFIIAHTYYRDTPYYQKAHSDSEWKERIVFGSLIGGLAAYSYKSLCLFPVKKIASNAIKVNRLFSEHGPSRYFLPLIH